jgi:TolA-binding protein
MRDRLLIFSIVLLLTLGSLGTSITFSKDAADADPLILVGVGAFRDGFYDIAENHLAGFVKDFPTHRRVHEACYLLGKTYYANGKYREARDMFRRIIREDKKFDNLDHALFWAGETDLRLGNGREARNTFLSLTQKYPKFEWMDYTYFLLGVLELKGNRFFQAESFFRMTTQLTKRQDLLGPATFWLGVSCFKRRDYEEAITYFERLQRDPQTLPLEYAKYALFWLGEAQVKTGRFSEAKGNYQAYYDRFKNDTLIPEIYWRLGFCEYQLGNTQGASQIFQTFKHQYRDSRFSFYAYYLLGKIFLTQEDYPSSIRELDLISHNPQGMALWGISLLAQYWNNLRLGAMDEASRVFQRLVKLNTFQDEQAFVQWLNAQVFFADGKISDALPYYFNLLDTRFREKALFQIGRGYFFEKKFREAMTNLDLLSLEFPDSRYLEEALFMKGECLVFLEDREQALESFQLILRQKKRHVWQMLAWVEIGNISLFQKSPDRARSAFQKAMEFFPEHPLSSYAALQLGNLEFQRKNLTEADRYYSAVLRGNVADLVGETSYRLGEVFYEQERFEKALGSFEFALRNLAETSPWFFLTQLEVANVQRRSNKVEEARKAYRAVLEHSRDEEIRLAAKEFLALMEPPSPAR